MEKSDLTSEQYTKLVEAIFRILSAKGLSDTTMDFIAKELTISKRTLYEIFGSKDEMFKDVLGFAHKRIVKNTADIVCKSTNVIQAIFAVLNTQYEIMTQTSAKFFTDMDTRYRHLRPDWEVTSKSRDRYLEQAIKIGIRQGLFLQDINYKIIIPMIRVQFEALKRMEELFASEITLPEAYREISIGMIRSITTEEGRKILENLISSTEKSRNIT